MEKEKRLAEKYEMVSAEGIDSVAILQEARERAQSRWKRLRLAVRIFLCNTNPSVSNNTAAADMHELYHHRSEDARISRSPPASVREPHFFIRGVSIYACP